MSHATGFFKEPKTTNMTNKILFFFVAILGLSACKSEAPAETFKPLDLIGSGVPITIMAPDSAKVTTDDLIVMQEVSIRKGEDYFVQIRYSDASSTDVAAIKSEEIADAKRDPFFTEITQEDPAGFIYKTQLDSVRASYGFRHIKIKGDKQYVFRNGIIGVFSEEATRAMYQGVQ